MSIMALRVIAWAVFFFFVSSFFSRHLGKEVVYSSTLLVNKF